jgi:hypothetical protein
VVWDAEGSVPCEPLAAWLPDVEMAGLGPAFERVPVVVALTSGVVALVPGPDVLATDAPPPCCAGVFG